MLLTKLRVYELANLIRSDLVDGRKGKFCAMGFMLLSLVRLMRATVIILCSCALTRNDRINSCWNNTRRGSSAVEY
ncbi:hypothetical protein PsorP6_015431 [Peronosclerospora sorghi]|uniref:Uncharacterized protein n=1 Tax=Peronosclerospora sorghi TaxID=230839 RepID=A0ACC0WMP1_9STRA|nr:hypothetical protein PsorP6_015431 [Peronosclerospora sorghi]